MKKFWPFIACLAIVLGIFVYIFGKKDPINPSTYGRLTLGMTQNQIEKVIGLPPGSYHNGQREIAVLRGPCGHYIAELGLPQDSIPEDWYDSPNPRVKRWWGNRHGIEVVFGENGEAVAIYLIEIFPWLQSARKERPGHWPSSPTHLGWRPMCKRPHPEMMQKAIAGAGQCESRLPGLGAQNVGIE